jgi:tetraacyldisaccharide 4'-kinase
MECRHVPRHLRDIHFGEQMDLDMLRGRRVAAFSGIAMPESFESFLKKCGALLVHQRRFPDHYRFTAADLDRAFECAQSHGAEWMITTEKDAVRLPLDRFYPLPTYYLRIEIEILRGREEFQRLIGRICAHGGADGTRIPPPGQ